MERAIGELRRGDPVLLTGKSESALILAAETVSQDALIRAGALAIGQGQLLLAPGRAAGLGISSNGALAVLSANISHTLLTELIDPTTAKTSEVPAWKSLPGDTLQEAGILLAKAARLLPAAIFYLVRQPDGAWERNADLMAVTEEDVRAFRVLSANTLSRVGEAQVPLAVAQDTRLIAFRPADGGLEHFAIVVGQPDLSAPVLTRIHSECFTGDLLGSLRCDCGEQLKSSISSLGAGAGGVVLYLAQEGRGIGLVNKLRAYRLQDQGLDTVDANQALGFYPDERVYAPAAEILRQLGITRVRLMTNNPDKVSQLASWGIEVVERVPLIIAANPQNQGYLRTKAERSGHLLEM